MRRKYRIIEPKANQLSAAFGREPYSREVDIYYANGEGTERADARVLAYAFETVEVHDGKSLREELIERGYDITTLKFSIDKLKE